MGGAAGESIPVIGTAVVAAKYRRQANESACQLMKRFGVYKAIPDTAIKHLPNVVEELWN